MPLNPFDLPDSRLRQIVRTLSPEALCRQLDQLADTMGDDAFGASMAREIVSRTRPEEAIPDTHARYRSLVRDGIEFFLSRINRRRLVDLVVNQLSLDAEACSSQARLLNLAQRFSTLHKLGQLIARYPDIDPAVRQWLIHLESGHYGTDYGTLLTRIRAELESTGEKDTVRVAPSILCEASVGAVISFELPSAPDRSFHQGVFKVLRPGIRGHLNEELMVLEKTATFFHDNRRRYPLKDFRFLEIFDDVREMMIHEIDLAAEQRLLEEAGRFYEDMPEVRIPRCLPISTGAMTAMELLEGPKLVDADMTGAQRKRMADALFTALVLKPLFSRHDPALFHGDPHAGNILAVFSPESADPAIGLVDWSLAGRMTRSDRIKTVHLIQAIIKKDLTGMCNAIRALTLRASHPTAMPRRHLRNLILRWMHAPEYSRMPLIKQAFQLLEALSMEGFVFPADLMLFRKAIFTLEGVLHDLWPPFDMNTAVTQHLMTLIQDELPMRLGNLYFPLIDRPENYMSLISNQDLHSLLAHRWVSTLFACSQQFMATLMQWGRIAGVPEFQTQSPLMLGDANLLIQKSVTADSA